MDIFGQALQQVISPAIVVASYLRITKVIDTKKENHHATIKL